MASARLDSLFRATGGNGNPDINKHPESDIADINWNENPGMPSISVPDLSTPYAAEFSSQFTSGTDLNVGSTWLPNTDDSYRDISNNRDFRLGHGLGISRAFRKQEGQSVHGGPESLFGPVGPTKNFGRSDTTYDANHMRVEYTERAAMALKKMGSKPDEKPDWSNYKPWDWNAQPGYGDPRYPNNHNYNRNWTRPDADSVTRRMYQPAPSRITKMQGVDIELASIAPQKTLMSAVNYIDEDRQRMKDKAIPKNVDVYENVRSGSEHGSVPRGMKGMVEAPRVYGDANQLRRPIATGETDGRSVSGRWNTPGRLGDDVLAGNTLDDRLIEAKAGSKYIRGHDIDREMQEFVAGDAAFWSQQVDDPYVLPSISGFQALMSTANGPFPDTAWPVKYQPQA